MSKAKTITLRPDPENNNLFVDESGNKYPAPWAHGCFKENVDDWTHYRPYYRIKKRKSNRGR
jgi:hypothetical protein